jgi:hypothetical protein
MAQCNRCGEEGFVWRQSKKGNWYMAVEEKWQGDMYGAIRTYYPAHRCDYYVETDPTARADAKNSAMIDAGYPGIV